MSTVLMIATLVGALTSSYALAIAIRNLRKSAQRRRETTEVVREGIIGKIFAGRDLTTEDLLVTHVKIREIDSEYWGAVTKSPVRALLRSTRPKEAKTIAEAPIWALRLLGPLEAKRYAREWGAHLRQLVDENEIEQARRDRRRLMISAITLGIVLRMRRMLKRAANSER